MTGLLPRLLRPVVGQVRYLRPVPARRARGLVAEVYRQLEEEFGLLAPPVALHAPVPELLAASWLMLRESLLADGPVPRHQRERVAAEVSRANACPYCVTVHGLAEAALAPTASGATSPDSDSQQPGSDSQQPGSTSQLLGVARTFHYLNRMVNVFLPESPLPAAAGAPGGGMLQRLLVTPAARPHPPGSSLALLPGGHRSAPDPVVEAFHRAEAAVHRAVDPWLPPGLAGLLPRLLAGWDGSPPPLGDGWLTDALATLPTGELPAGRFAVLTALSSYRVTPAVVADFRNWQPADEALLSIAAWASLLTARRLVDGATEQRQR